MAATIGQQRTITMRRLGRHGRWGNQIAQYAFLRVYAAKHGLSYQVPQWAGQHLFRLPPAPIATDLPEQHWTFEGGNSLARPLLPGDEFIGRDYVGCGLYHTSWYARHRELVLSLYDKLTPYADELVRPLRPAMVGGGRVRIGIHIRRGDTGNNTYYLTPITWYLDWLKRHYWKYQSPVLYVASENESLAGIFHEYNPVTAASLGYQRRDYIEPGYEPLQVDIDKANANGIDFFVDWWALQQCHVVLGGNSSYSFSAAWASRNLLEYWRSRLSLQRFEPVDPWNCDPSQYEHLDDYPGIPGTSVDANDYWQPGFRNKHRAVPEGLCTS